MGIAIFNPQVHPWLKPKWAAVPSGGVALLSAYQPSWLIPLVPNIQDSQSVIKDERPTWLSTLLSPCGKFRDNDTTKQPDILS